jgi:hypothetical protein
MADEILSLAVSMQSNPGVYALLLGSGTSSSAGMPTGWHVVEDLIRNIAQMKKAKCEPDPVKWYEKEFGKQPQYTAVIDELVKSPSERSQLLRHYFEPTDEERKRGLKLPTPAHKAIARLASQGYVRVIVTTNFDRLMESALEAEGVNPVVLSTPDSIDGAMPLVHMKCCVLKLHGDYRDTRILNTAGEVDSYDVRVNRLLDQVLNDFGLVVCGWSAEWDSALRGAINRCPTRRFSTYWTARGELTTPAKELIQHRHAQVIEIDSADVFFSELSENIDSLDELAQRRSLATSVDVETLKRYLADPKDRIRLHDLVADERERLYQQLNSGRFPAQGVVPDPTAIAARMDLYESLCERLGDFLIAGCYYGERHHQHFWTDCIERIASVPSPEAGYIVWTSLRSYPALILLYLGGMAAIAAGNYETLATVLMKPKVRIGSREESVLDRVSGPNVLEPRQVQALPGMERRKTPMSQYLEEHLRAPLRKLVPDERTYLSTFDRFEYILALVYMDQHERGWAPVGCFAWRHDFGDASPAETLAIEIAKMGESWPLVKAGMFAGSIKRAIEVKAGLDDFVARMSHRIMFS